jgi:hypothetical protein
MLLTFHDCDEWKKLYKKPGGVNKTEIESLIFVVFIFVHVYWVDEPYTGDY